LLPPLNWHYHARGSVSRIEQHHAVRPPDPVRRWTVGITLLRRPIGDRLHRSQELQRPMPSRQWLSRRLLHLRHEGVVVIIVWLLLLRP
jgi:hypothetical protein